MSWRGEWKEVLPLRPGAHTVAIAINWPPDVSRLKRQANTRSSRSPAHTELEMIIEMKVS